MPLYTYIATSKLLLYRGCVLEKSKCQGKNLSRINYVCMLFFFHPLSIFLKKEAQNLQQNAILKK